MSSMNTSTNTSTNSLTNTSISSLKIRLFLDLQKAIESETIPAEKTLAQWVKTTLLLENPSLEADTEFELTIRVVDKKEIQTLNKSYRHKDKPTNVLSFPYEGFEFEVPEEVQLPLLGDLIICHDIVLEEAQQQGKTIEEHWAHMVVHGVLHLKAYDHINDDEAEQMEALEINILQHLQFPNPYL